MILILTQCFPSRIGGVENLISNLSLSLSNSEKIIVFADSHHLTNDAQYDNLYKKKRIETRRRVSKIFLNIF